MRRKNRRSLAQSILEYTVVMIVVVAALIAMFGFLKRHLQAKWQESADTFGQGRQYEH
jgi:Flp pilus assembly pilin Flp